MSPIATNDDFIKTGSGQREGERIQKNTVLIGREQADARAQPGRDGLWVVARSFEDVLRPAPRAGVSLEQDEGLCVRPGKKPTFKSIMWTILPRQARDKHSGKLRKDSFSRSASSAWRRFSTQSQWTRACTATRGVTSISRTSNTCLYSIMTESFDLPLVFGSIYNWLIPRSRYENVTEDDPWGWIHENGQNDVLFEPFIYTNEHFTKTCSGQT